VRDSACAGADVVGRAVLFGVVVAVTIAACGDDQPQQEGEQQPPQQAGGSQQCTPPGDSYRGARGAFVSWAEDMSYQADSSRAYVYGFTAADSVRIEAAVLDTAGPGGLSPYGCVYARITSARAVPARGIAAGANYLMVDSVGGAARTVVIPAETGAPITTHAVVLHAHTEGSPPPAAVGTSGSCGQCKKMWCRATFDSPTTLRE
jgi:hypothetical protein